MSLPSIAMVEEVKSQLLSIMDTPIGTPAMAEIDRELTPIITELLTLEAWSEQHPTVMQLFDWLVHPHRTVEEFIYVVGPLGYSVGNSTNLYLTAAEALAVKCPVLEGPWEHITWLLIQRLVNDIHRMEAVAFDRLSTWLIYVIGDADICPNPYLRLELICLLRIFQFEKHNQTQVFEAIMSACSILSMDYLSKYYGHISSLNFIVIVNIFDLEIEDGCMLQFGDKLANKLNDVNTARLLSTLHDVSYQCGLNPNKCTEPRELQSLIALLNTTAGYARRELKKLEADMDIENEELDICCHDSTFTMFKMLICNFKACLQMPQLIYPTATFIMDVLEFLLLCIVADGYGDEIDDDGLYWQVTQTDQLLQELLTEDGSTTLDKSVIGREVISKYGGRLRRIRGRFGDFDNLPMICSLLNHA